MGLFDMFKKKGEARVEEGAPASVAAVHEAGALCAPVPGEVIAMSEVPDPVFSEGVLGAGCAVWPAGDVVYAPVDGTVTVTMGHAVGIMSADGVEVLVHVGVDTVNMQGKGFTGYVSEGDAVVAGQPLLKMDRAAIAEAGYRDCVVMAVSNTAELSSVGLAVEPGVAVEPGSVVVRAVR